MGSMEDEFFRRAAEAKCHGTIPDKEPDAPARQSPITIVKDSAPAVPIAVTQEDHNKSPRNSPAHVALGIGFVGLVVLISVIVSTSIGGSGAPSSPTRRDDSDPRDGRWNSPARKEVIRAMAKDAGVNEDVMRKEVNDEIDRRGLQDYAK